MDDDTFLTRHPPAVFQTLNNVRVYAAVEGMEGTRMYWLMRCGDVTMLLGRTPLWPAESMLADDYLTQLLFDTATGVRGSESVCLPELGVTLGADPEHDPTSGESRTVWLRVTMHDEYHGHTYTEGKVTAATWWLLLTLEQLESLRGVFRRHWFGCVDGPSGGILGGCPPPASQPHVDAITHRTAQLVPNGAQPPTTMRVTLDVDRHDHVMFECRARPGSLHLTVLVRSLRGRHIAMRHRPLELQHAAQLADALAAKLDVGQHGETYVPGLEFGVAFGSGDITHLMSVAIGGGGAAVGGGFWSKPNALLLTKREDLELLLSFFETIATGQLVGPLRGTAASE